MQRVSTDRRDFMKAVGVLAVTTVASSLGMRGASAQQVPYSAGTEAPKLKAPANACDCHMHIYDAKYPVAPSATLKPPDALVADYKLLQNRISTTRNVIVTPSTYGTDNRVTLDAIAQIGPTARGVAVVDTSVPGAELKRMNDLGIRGIRFNLVQAGVTTIEMIEPLSKRVNDLGWHIQIHMKGEQIAGIEDLLLRVPSPIVFDHLGRLAQPNALDNPGFKTISKLIDKGKTWVKLSGAYQDGCPRLRQSCPRTDGVGERLAASHREGKAERCGAFRPAGGMVARPGDAQRYPGAKPCNPLRVSAIRVTGRSEQSL